MFLRSRRVRAARDRRSEAIRAPPGGPCAPRRRRVAARANSLSLSLSLSLSSSILDVFQEAPLLVTIQARERPARYRAHPRAQLVRTVSAEAFAQRPCAREDFLGDVVEPEAGAQTRRRTLRDVRAHFRHHRFEERFEPPVRGVPSLPRCSSRFAVAASRFVLRCVGHRTAPSQQPCVGSTVANAKETRTCQTHNATDRRATARRCRGNVRRDGRIRRILGTVSRQRTFMKMESSGRDRTRRRRAC